MSEQPLEGTSLVVGDPPTAWRRAFVDAELAGAAGMEPVWLVLTEGGALLDDHVEGGASDRDPYWRAAERQIDGAAAHLEDVRDGTGALQELVGPCAAALASKRFRKAALHRLGARHAFAATPDGTTLRLRDAWRIDPPHDAAELAAGGLLPGTSVWLVAEDGVRGVVIDGGVVDARGARTELVPGATGPADRDQIIFARALLAFLGGLVLALVLAGGLALR